MRFCLRDPIPEIFDAARLLDRAVTAHLTGDTVRAADLFRVTNNPQIRDWTESLWGRGGPWTQPSRPVDNPPPHLPKDQRPLPRMPSRALKAALIARDGYHCRFCGIPLVRHEVRRRISRAYPEAACWGRTNPSQHAALQAMWLQYDHILPHSRGGTTDLDNLVITCAPCNFGRTEKTLEEVGLADPRLRAPVLSTWDGLERF